MYEIELKLQIPAHKYLLLHKAFLTKTTQKIDLHARYFDTQDCKLAKKLMALRIRKEGEHWIQTFKSSGESHLQRFEHEFDLGTSKKIPSLNLAIYQNEPQALALLNQALGEHWQALELQFETIVQRHYRIIDLNQSKIEVCLDLGSLKSQQHERPIQEVEFELKSGQIHDLIALTSQWVNRYHLWLDVRSKAERGHLLAQNKRVSPATTMQAFQLDAHLSAENAIKAMVANCLEHILPNVAAISEHIADASHVHQARVAIRRLRSLLKHFSGWSTQMNTTWNKQLAELFRQLGNSRDQTIIQQSILPKMKKAGLNVQLATTMNDDAILSSIFQDPLTTQLWLELLDFAYTPNLALDSTYKLKTKAAKVLKKLHHKIAKSALNYKKLNLTQKHDLRKELKALRYNIEFVQGLYSKKTTQRYVKKLASLQKVFGQYHDILLVEQLLDNQKPSPSHTWLKQQQKCYEKALRKKLKKFLTLDVFW
ncbi:CHAD domain-containing protein [Acinetobacter sp. MD2(2019)]|uniref:CYTH and CHAD domain-containing protein n=1 Tax=Acinetobacter sp. MD2(2019) TaxID=2605273 RepID=UPI002D1F4584|nr:CHAD domain-containing protein [Acinetobacter sp. MD2(2019)]MEB3753392.1 CHAD domain-containing protein [Acinetobacter sp. MD2(2019)]